MNLAQGIPDYIDPDIESNIVFDLAQSYAPNLSHINHCKFLTHTCILEKKYPGFASLNIVSSGDCPQDYSYPEEIKDQHCERMLRLSGILL